MARPLRVTILLGSARAERTSDRAALAAKRLAEAAGAEVDLLDVRELDLRAYPEGEEDHPGVARLVASFAQADAAVLVTPEYHGSYTGVLKNALDFLSSHQCRHKPFLLVGVSTGALGGVKPLSHLRDVVRALGAVAIPAQVALPLVKEKLDPAGAPLDAAFEKRFHAAVEELLAYARALAPMRGAA